MIHCLSNLILLDVNRKSATIKFKEATESERKCNPNYETWRSSNGESCSYFYISNSCTKYAGYGTGWPVSDGNFTDLSFDNFTPWSCPQCGCSGNYKTIP